MANVTTREIQDLLAAKYRDHRQFAYAFEVGNATGTSQIRRIDMVVVNCYESKGLAIEGIEIKVSKSDLRRELQDASKHNVFYKNLNYFSLAAPKEIIDKSLIPPKWGIYAVNNGELITVRKPLSLHDERDTTIDKKFAVSLIRSIFNYSPERDALEKAKNTAWNQGFEAGKANVMSRGLQRTEEELKALERLKQELILYGKESIENGIEQFKEFQKINLEGLEFRLNQAKKAIDGTLESLKNHETKAVE